MTGLRGKGSGLCVRYDSSKGCSCYIIRSNRESGEGRYDIQLIPRVKSFPGILIELKSAGKDKTVDLKRLAESALAQIADKRYETEMISEGITTIWRYGVAFCGKEVEIATG